MIIIIDKKVLDSTEEAFEITNNMFGFNVVIKDAKTQNFLIFNNVSEVHYKYETPFNEPRVAFESDFHSTGFTYEIDSLDMIIITNATKISNKI